MKTELTAGAVAFASAIITHNLFYDIYNSKLNSTGIVSAYELISQFAIEFELLHLNTKWLEETEQDYESTLIEWVQNKLI